MAGSVRGLWLGAMIAAAVPAWAQSVSFSQATNYPTGPGPRSVVIADFTGDGVPDLVTANLQGANVSLLAGTGGGAFSVPVNFAVGSMPAFVATADFNGDGAADLAVANLSSGSVSILLGNGAGGVQSAASLSSPNGPTSIAIADFNHDLHLDLAVGGVNTGNVYIFLGNGAGAFTPHGFVQGGGTGSHAVATGEFNGDTHPDLAVADFFVAGAATGVSILLGSGTGTFVLHETVDVAPKPQHIAIGDFNGDGAADLAVAYAGPNGSAGGVALLLGTGTGGFGSPTSFAAGNLAIFVVSQDLNGDAILDLAVANLASGNTVSVLVGAGNGSFDPPLQFAVGNRSGSVAVADLNADGLPDLAVTNENDNTVSVLLNSGIGGQPQGVLTVSRSGTGSGTVTSNPLGINCGADCAESYQLGTSVTLTAAASSNSYFAGWTGSGCSGTAPCSVSVNGDVTVTATFTATRFVFTDDPLTSGTVMKAVHLTELRQAINALRADHQLPAFGFTDATLVPAVTVVRALHIEELRAALLDVYDAMGRAVPAITDPTLIPGVTTIKRAHVVELRDAVRAIE